MSGNHPTADKLTVEMYANHENKKRITAYCQVILQYYYYIYISTM
jgi:hypothetical protein